MKFWRWCIWQLDLILLWLIFLRGYCVKQIQEYKIRHGIAVRDKIQEAAILIRLERANYSQYNIERIWQVFFEEAEKYKDQDRYE